MLSTFGSLYCVMRLYGLIFLKYRDTFFSITFLITCGSLQIAYDKLCKLQKAHNYMMNVNYIASVTKKTIKLQIRN